MGMTITRYTDQKHIGFACRMASGNIAVCRLESTARRLAETGVVRLNVADHCTLGDSKKAVVFTTRDQSFAALSSAVGLTEMNDEGYPCLKTETIDMPDAEWDS
jgi:hypothetical protein